VLDLTSHISAIVTMMTVASDWDNCVEMVDRVKPKFTISDIETQTDEAVKELNKDGLVN